MARRVPRCRTGTARSGTRPDRARVFEYPLTPWIAEDPRLRLFQNAPDFPFKHPVMKSGDGPGLVVPDDRAQLPAVKTMPNSA